MQRAQRRRFSCTSACGSDPAPCCSIAAEQFAQQYVWPPWTTCVVGSTIGAAQWAHRPVRSGIVEPPIREIIESVPEVRANTVPDETLSQTRSPIRLSRGAVDRTKVQP